VIEKHTCRNGLRIVLEEVPHVRSVTIGVWVLTGSRDETEQNNGISHFIEHMLFKGTESRTAQQIAEAFESIGGQVNAFTSKEYTCFYARVLDSYKEYAISILADMLFHSTFLEEELEKEKKVVLEEIKMYEDAPDDHVHDLLADASFHKHALGRTILGTEEQIQSFSKQMIVDYMDKKYTPNHIVISIAGNVNEDFFSIVEKHFDQFSNEKRTKERIKPDFTGRSIVQNREVEQAHLCFGYEGLSIKDKDLVTMSVINNVLGGGMSSRLFQEVREKRGLAYAVFSYHSAYLDSGLLTLYAGTNKDELTLLQTTIENIIEELVANGLTDKELKNSKEQLKGNIMLGLESTSSRMSRNGRNELLLQRHRSLDEIIEDIDKVNLQKTHKLMEQIFNGKYASAIIMPK